MAKLKITTTNSVTGSRNDQYVSPTLINGSHIGGTAGDTSQSTPTLRIRYYLNSTLYTGYIVTQKGSNSFLVRDTANANVTNAQLVNLQSAELSVANTASMIANVATFAGANIANIGTRTSATVTWTAANVAGYATPVVGYQLLGTGLTGNVTITAVNSATNVTVSCTTQTVSNAQAAVTESFNIKNINNKYVRDWNNVKWRYSVAAPYTNGVAVLASQPAWQAVTLVQVDSA